MRNLLPASDARIQDDVLRELKWDQRVKETEVGVEVHDGVVTLTGTVDNWAKRRAAQDAAHRVKGVLDVANDIEVRWLGGEGESDTEIAQAVRHALVWDVFVPDDAIVSTVSRGWVTLEGNVETWSQRDAAEAAIRNLTHVHGVINKIIVEPMPVFPGEVRRAIEEALERRAEREAGRIAVEVEDGRVTLSGMVNSWQEKQTVLGAAKGTAGVRTVDDRLQVGIFVE